MKHALALFIGSQCRPVAQQLVEVDEFGWQTFLRVKSFDGAAKRSGDALKRMARGVGGWGRSIRHREALTSSPFVQSTLAGRNRAIVDCEAVRLNLKLRLLSSSAFISPFGT
jgi:hypothetical protein